MEYINKNTLDKFYGLLFFLKKSKRDFEEVAEDIGDSPLRAALNGISKETHYFAEELKQQLCKLGFFTEIKDENEYNFVEPAPITNGEPGSELLYICTNLEKSLLNYYVDILKDNIAYKSLKEIMVYQMSAIKYEFAKINMLNVSRFSKVSEVEQ